MLFVPANLLANGRGRWLAVAASLVISAGMFYAQDTERPAPAAPAPV
ncbi:glycoside hydrolase, partial [Mycobacterium rufum]|nr:glycoside hydrolase [Mycolicibacterium rufum]